MGTNFFGWKQITSLPAFCLINIEEAYYGEPIDNQEIIHLGNWSCGWKFLAQWNDGKYYTNKEEYLNFAEELEIFDEFGNSIGFNEFTNILNTGKGKTQERNNLYGLKDTFFGESSKLEFSNGNWS